MADRRQEFIERNRERWLDELRALCAIPSVSARHEAIEPCAALVAELLRERGFEAEVSPTGGHPIVYGRAALEGRRRLLFYNHYDVQPPEPLELWESPPFEASLRDGKLFARGVKDDKGELVARLAALDLIRELQGGCPVDLTWIVDGEEEVGSPSLPAWVEENRHRLEADGAIWEEGFVDAEGRPDFRLGARGILYVQLSVRTINRDAHSGYANLYPNAAWRLVWALSTLKDESERILIEGFYDEARPPSERQQQLMAELPDETEELKREYGVRRLLLGRSGVDVHRAVFEPTCNLAGIGSGYQDEGSKTVLPAAAFAKIDFRLVPDQDPADIFAKLRRHLDQHGFEDVEAKVLGGTVKPATVDPDDPLVRLNVETAREVFGKEPRLEPIIGGTTPMYLFTDRMPVIDPGLGYDGTRAHSPNENIRLADFENAVKHIALILERFDQI